MAANGMKIFLQAWFNRIARILVLCLGIGVVLGAQLGYAGVHIQHWVTSEGARVYFVENHDLPLLDVSVEFPAGSSRDAKPKSGVAVLTLHMLSHGAAGLSDNALADRFADVGAILSDSFDQDRAGVRLRTLSSGPELQSALDTLALVLQQPDFPASVLTREKARMIAALKEAQTQPEEIADKAFYAGVYPQHPYGLPPGGDIPEVETITRADMVNFYRSFYQADQAVVAMIGDISVERARAIAEQLVKGLPVSPVKAAPLPAVQPLELANTVEVSHPATQSHILIGSPGLKRGDADYFPLYVGNYILGGGGFSSRLIEEVRQRRGLVYDVHSYFLPLKQEGPFQIGLQTEKTQTRLALQVVFDTLKRFIKEGPSVNELEQAKQNLINGFVLRIDSNKDILEHIAMIGFYGLPLTYLDDYPRAVGKVTLGQIKDAFARRVKPDAMVTVIVGAAEDATAGAAEGSSLEPASAKAAK
jgi:zinc protease